MEIQRPVYMERLIAKKGNGLVKVVTGVRRYGKSYLLLKMFREHLAGSGVAPGNIVELAFDRFSSAQLRDPGEFYSWVTARLGETGPGVCYVLLDEMQLLGRFEEALIDLMAMPGVDVYVTDSNARLLSNDVATEFRGRGDEIELRPLSFSEYAAARDVDPQRAYEEYSVYGGMHAGVRGRLVQEGRRREGHGGAAVRRRGRPGHGRHRLPARPGQPGDVRRYGSQLATMQIGDSVENSRT